MEHEGFIYTVASDFHENADVLDGMLKKFSETQIVVLGDFFDGVNVKNKNHTMAEVITKLATGGYELRYKPIIVRGNHDEMLVRASEGNAIDLELWLQNGGMETLHRLGYTGFTNSAYDVADFLNKEYKEVVELLKNSEYVSEKENIVFVHGGLDLDANVPVLDTPNEDMLWYRDDYYFEHGTKKDKKNTVGKTIVSGHTPTQVYGYKGHIMELKHDANDKPRYVIDGGSNSGDATGHVNVVQFDYEGKLVDYIEMTGE